MKAYLFLSRLKAINPLNNTLCFRDALPTIPLCPPSPEAWLAKSAFNCYQRHINLFNPILRQHQAEALITVFMAPLSFNVIPVLPFQIDIESSGTVSLD